MFPNREPFNRKGFLWSLRDLIIEFKRIGSNLDKITHLAGSDTSDVVADNLKSIKEDLKTVWAKLAVVMKKL